MKYFFSILLIGFLFLGAGCAKENNIQPNNTQEPFSDSAYEQNLAEMLTCYGNNDVEVEVHFRESLTAFQANALLTSEGSPEIFQLTPESIEPNIQGGLVPFSGELTDESLNRAVKEYSNTRLDSEFQKQINSVVSSGGNFFIVQFKARGKADVIRDWWHNNLDIVSEVKVIKGTLIEGVESEICSMFEKLKLE